MLTEGKLCILFHTHEKVKLQYVIVKNMGQGILTTCYMTIQTLFCLTQIMLL